MKILVTGAGGGLGRELPNVLINDELVLADRRQLDVTNSAVTNSVIHSAKPDLVIHAAAYTAVDKAESEPEVARAVNVKGTKNVAEATALVNAALVYIGTDYVFDGTKDAPYVETDLNNPLSVYGQTKLDGETAALAANPKTFVVRTSWLYSQTGKSFVTTMLRLFKARDPSNTLSVVSDEVSAPTYAKDLTRAIRALVEAEDYGTYHAASQGETSWHGFATEIATQTGHAVTIEPTTAKSYGLPARRPGYSKLATGKLNGLGIELPDWREGLRGFMADRSLE